MGSRSRLNSGLNTAQAWAAPWSRVAAVDAALGEAGRRGKYRSCDFTKHGATLAANLRSSPRAIEVSGYAVRGFVRLRELDPTHGGPAKRLAELEESDLPKRPIGFISPED